VKEGEKYDRNFTLLSLSQQEEELQKQKDTTAEMNRRLGQYFAEYAKYLRQLPKGTLYESLSKFVFGTPDIKEIESRFSQNQRRSFRLKIVDFIEDIPVFVPRRQPTGLALATLSLLLIFFATQRQSFSPIQNPKATAQVLAASTQNNVRGFPVRLIIPSINVNAAVEYVGVTPIGIMGVPVDTADVGWFDFGPRPGEKGSAVIAGHLDGVNGEAAVFANLNQLKKGDKLYVLDGNGNTTSFTVQGSREYDVGYADEVFSRNDGNYLNLITCDGVWDGTKESYNKRLVVFADVDN
jgi:LPXTG-site transpeptidase (sortase) family protein